MAPDLFESYIKLFCDPEILQKAKSAATMIGISVVGANAVGIAGLFVPLVGVGLFAAGGAAFGKAYRKLKNVTVISEVCKEQAVKLINNW